MPKSRSQKRIQPKSRMMAKIANMNSARLEKLQQESTSGFNYSEVPLPPVTPQQSASSSSSTASSDLSASRRKLAYFANVTIPIKEATLPTTIVDLQCLESLVTGLKCSDCGSSQLELRSDPQRIQGLAVCLSIFCLDCDSVRSEAFTSKKCSQKIYELNRALVFASLYIGIGYNSLAKLSELMGMEMMTSQSYNDHVKAIEKAMMAELVSIFAESVAQVKSSNSNDRVHDIAVSYDGTWAKRGHTSKLGVGVVIDVTTGLALDCHVMSTYCQQCTTVGDSMRLACPQKYATWFEEHKPKCSKNFSGSSGAMEVEAARIMWGRSEMLHDLRYTTLVSDGDTKTFSALSETRPYGMTDITKQECINHVAKRLNTALRNLVNTENKRGVRLGGAGLGNLTQTKMGLLQSYYTKAVRTYNSSVDEMSDAIWAAFYHSTSTDDSPNHQKCPPGPESWCFFQRAIGKDLTIPSHKGRLTTYLNPKVAPYVKEIYIRLTEPKLLERCLLGKTQNTNESLHGMIWSRCPKHLFSGLTRVKIATAFAVGEFNQGAVATHRFLTAVGCAVTSKSIQMGARRNIRRLKKADTAILEVSKTRRKIREIAKLKDNESHQKEEGGASYLAGGF